MQLQKFLGPVAVLFGIVNAFAQPPKTWDAKALADWATPIAGLKVFGRVTFPRKSITGRR